MTSTPRCQNCTHTPHPDRACRYSRVSGPADPKAKADGNHGMRDVTPCNCPGYAPALNGSQR